MSELVLRLRTPAGLLLDSPVTSVTAEDRTGWFGIRPGRTDLVAVLPPGLLVFVDDEGEGFVALSGGLLDLRSGECRVLTGDATLSRDLDAIADAVRAQRRSRTERADAHRGVMRDLAREALRRLIRGRR
jgi:F-type H+-transporting ATPase subunit epsilon